ncbi:Histone deacetylase (HDAC) interacting [Rhizoctonia solani]|uniref:Histone deacetylase (HDAC) interacting n=1 Tax=Rhizoctonia solani TaxID=456999 RepID=A0A8H7IAM2_9AGAM|nr:Histone deacetylase (HDAC) interacting [Rhizoctonia solani]
MTGAASSAPIELVSMDIDAIEPPPSHSPSWSTLPRDVPAPPSSEARALNAKDPLSYLEMIKFKFQDKPDVYQHFLDVMMDFKSQAIDTPGVIDRVSSLFNGHTALIQGFNTFLLEITISTALSTSTATALLRCELREQDQAALRLGPDTYKQFLEILQTYQKEQRPIAEVYQQVNVLFNNQRDLLEDFQYFLPDHGGNGGSVPGQSAGNSGALFGMVAQIHAAESNRISTQSGSTKRKGVGDDEPDSLRFKRARADSGTQLQMLQYLEGRGCRDLGPSIIPDQFSQCRVAEGAFGDVYKRRLNDGTNVAIKALRYALVKEDGGAKRAMMEIYYWSKLNHKNVSKLLGITMLEERLAMVSEWMENGTLNQYLKKNPTINRYELCLQVTDGLIYLHGKDMYNILISLDGIPKLTDFDLSIRANASLVFSPNNHAGAGTLRWMAPEIARGQDKSKQSDVYALGMVYTSP